MLLAANRDIPLAAWWLSSLLGSGMRSDVLPWMATTLTRILYWHQPLRNNKHVMRCLLDSYHEEQPSTSLWLCLDNVSAVVHWLCWYVPLQWGTQWFLTRYLNIWKVSRRTQRCASVEPRFACFSSGFLQNHVCAQWYLSWRKTCIF